MRTHAVESLNGHLSEVSAAVHGVRHVWADEKGLLPHPETLCLH